MFLIELIPLTIIYLLLGLSIAVLLASFLLVQLPFVNQYALPAQIISTVVLCFSLYSSGVLNERDNYEDKLKEARQEVVRITKLSEEAAKTNEVKTETKVETQQEKTKEIIKYVKVFIPKKDDDKYVIPESFIRMHNYSAENTIPTVTGNIQSGPSDVKISEFETTVAENYGTYYELRERYIGLRDLWLEQEKIFNGK